jgi:osmotically-inducible protein OsmY
MGDADHVRRRRGAAEPVAEPVAGRAAAMGVTARRCVALIWLSAVALGGCSTESALLGAGATVGVAASQERGLSGAIEDTEIRARINHLWLQSDEELYRKVSLQVQEARVLLTGQVPTRDMRLEAVRLAWQVDGVREVINEIEVDDPSALGFAGDTWISTQLKSKLLFDRDVSSINYSIETVDGVVYLMGVAQDKAELDRVVAHARNLRYVRGVVSYVRVKQPLATEAASDQAD